LHHRSNSASVIMHCPVWITVTQAGCRDCLVGYPEKRRSRKACPSFSVRLGMEGSMRGGESQGLGCRALPLSLLYPGFACRQSISPDRCMNRTLNGFPWGPTPHVATNVPAQSPSQTNRPQSPSLPLPSSSPRTSLPDLATHHRRFFHQRSQRKPHPEKQPLMPTRGCRPRRDAKPAS
jgi:hypothetical protein